MTGEAIALYQGIANRPKRGRVQARTGEAADHDEGTVAESEGRQQPSSGEWKSNATGSSRRGGLE